MTESEREMLREPLPPTRYRDGETSLQPTYEDSVAPEADGYGSDREESSHDAG